MLQDVRGQVCRLTPGLQALLDAHIHAIEGLAPGSTRVVWRLLDEAIDEPSSASPRFLETLRELCCIEDAGGRGFSTRSERKGLPPEDLGNASRYGYIEPIRGASDSTARRLTEAGRKRLIAHGRASKWIHSSLLGRSLLDRPELESFRDAALQHVHRQPRLMFGIWLKQALIDRPDAWTRLSAKTVLLGTQYVRGSGVGNQAQG